MRNYIQIGNSKLGSGSRSGSAFGSGSTGLVTRKAYGGIFFYFYSTEKVRNAYLCPSSRLVWFSQCFNNRLDVQALTRPQPITILRSRFWISRPKVVTWDSGQWQWSATILRIFPSKLATWPGTARRQSSSVADPGCLSRIPDPDFYPSRIPDPDYKNSNKREGWKKICCHTIFFYPQTSQNWKLFYFWNAEENNLGQFSKNCCTFYPKNCQ